MFTQGELQIIGEDAAMDAINRAVTKMVVSGGQVNLSGLNPQQIEEVVHMLRQFKAFIH